MSYDRPESLDAPVTKGEQIGTAKVIDGYGTVVREVALRVEEDVERQGFLDVLGALCRAVSWGG